MSPSLKSLSSLAIVLLLGATLSCDASAARSDENPRTSPQINACVTEIGRHADYEKAVKVVHWVSLLEQERTARLRMVIETTVVLNATGQNREYRASCLADARRGVLDFRIDDARTATEQDDRNGDSENLRDRLAD